MRWQRIVFSVTVTEGLLTEVSEKRKGCGRKAIPPVVARILSGDSTSPLTRDGHGCPKLNAQSFARMRNQQSVHMARMWCGARYYCLFAMVVGMERVDATEAIPPVVARILSGDSTSPLTREARI